MGTLDAAELAPTYSVPPEQAFGLLAEGESAMYVAVEGAEDSKDLAAEVLDQTEGQVRDAIQRDNQEFLEERKNLNQIWLR